VVCKNKPIRGAPMTVAIRFEKDIIPKPTPVPDLMEMLKKSLESEKVKSRNES